MVQLGSGQYNVSEQDLDPLTPPICNRMGFEAGREASSIEPNLFVCTNFSEECEGDMIIGNPQTCTIENVLIPQTGMSDLAVANQDSNDISILLANGNGKFGTETYYYAVGSQPQSIAVCDFNSDRELDLVTTILYFQ